MVFCGLSRAGPTREPREIVVNHAIGHVVKALVLNIFDITSSVAGGFADVPMLRGDETSTFAEEMRGCCLSLLVDVTSKEERVLDRR